MFEPDHDAPVVDIHVVARGDSPRLRACLTSLTGHAAAVPFRVTCIVNPVGRQDPPVEGLPPGIRVVVPDLNLGWPGGLHLARTLTRSPFMVTAQDDMVVAEGWLDALVDTARRHPGVGAVGSVEVDAVTRLPNGDAGGFAEPPDDVNRWNDTDVLRSGADAHDVALDWITSKGMLIRAEAFDAVRGADPRLFPLNHVDKDLSIHLRCHGWTIMVAPDAHIIHEGRRSAPRLFREFLTIWQEPDFNARWEDVVRALGPGRAAVVPHECVAWAAGDMPEIEKLIAREASLMLVPFSRYAFDRLEDITSQLERSEEVRAQLFAELVRTQAAYRERDAELGALRDQQLRDRD